ncbi:putative pentatricopeptide repeat-containing protein At3g01580 [Actinidia eriantha]|uniref:putative pentatricopeptide repeat-containing protein At3g01580 n=1 Tax=Actinidia eriantha TaxID=165200 RepID=UPI00258C5155|nr:putative pentatricopeptide repeat-containing protein At3g01580 [Actinidia eriantha]
MKKSQILIDLFRSCSDGRSIAQLHSQIIKTGRSGDTLVVSKLSNSYAKYAPIEGARKVFDEMPHPTVHSWNSILRSYCREKQYGEVLVLFPKMVSLEKPDNLTIPIVVKACARFQELEFGKMVHGFVKKCGDFGSDLFVGSALVELYSKCGWMSDALRVFEEYCGPDVVLWTAIISGYEQNGYPEEAVAIFIQMVKVEGLSPDTVTLVSVVSACGRSVNLRAGRSVHGFAIRMGFDCGLSLGNALLNLYAKTDALTAANRLFRKMEQKDVISWSTVIAAHVQNGAAAQALEIFDEMIDQRFEPNAVSVINALQACEATCNLEKGKKIHELASFKGFEFDISVSTVLIDMYMKCASPDEAINLFQRMPKKDVVTWVALLSGFVQNGMADKAMGVFCHMQSRDIRPDSIAMVKILTACSELGILQQAFCLHGLVVKGGFSSNAFVVASLIELYSKCGSLENAVKVFESVNLRDIVIWSSMAAGYGIHGRGKEALKLLHQMVKDSKITPNNVTFLSILSACSHAGLVEEGLKLFEVMVREHGLTPDVAHYGILVDLLSRSGEFDKAISIIDQMPVQPEPHVWGALLGACRIHQNINVGELAARNLLCLDPNHAGYYTLLSNLYAVNGKWDNAEKIKALLNRKNLKKMVGLSAVEVRNEIHSFLAVTNSIVHTASTCYAEQYLS